MSVGPHLTREEISEAADGLLPPDRQQAVAGHLAGCESCRAIRDQVVGVRELLREAAAERPAMPDQVTDRLLAAITAEARRPRPVAGPQHAGDAGAASGDAPTNATVVRHARSRRGRRRMAARASRMLAAAAAVAVVAIGGTMGYRHLVADPASTTATGDDRTATTSHEPTRTQSPERPRTLVKPTGTAYAIVGAPKLTSAGFDTEVIAVIRPASKVTGQSLGRPRRQTAVGNCPGHAVAEAGGGTVLDQAAATFDQTPADLVLTRSQVADAVEVYVVIGCPGSGKIAHHRTVRPSR